MESKDGARSDSKGPAASSGMKNGNHSPELGKTLSAQDIPMSESKTPLKTPVKDIDDDLQVNGDAKIDMDHVKTCFSGMSKEELLKYANDPFWVRTRMFLFVFFWIVWIAMFAGAVTIIVLAPKCDPPKWHSQGPIYDVELSSFVGKPSADGLLNAFAAKLSYLSDLNVKGMVLSPIFKIADDSDNLEDVVNFKDIDKRFGSLDDFKNLVKESKARGIHLIVTFVPNHSSDKHVWFNKSVAREEPFDDYYVWAKGSGPEGSNGSAAFGPPPNNWISVTGGSAWEWNNDRKEYYLHQFGVHQPDLNFRSPHVLKEFNETLNFWMELGVTSFNLDKVQYLLEDKDLEDEEIRKTKAAVDHTDYNFYYHSKTYNRPENAEILSQWREMIHAKTNGDGILMINGDAPIPADSNETTKSVDIMRNDRLLTELPRNFSASDLYPRIQRLARESESWPVFQLGGPSNRLADRFNDDDIDGLNIITLLIKGTPVVYFGEELGLRGSSPFPWSNDSHSVVQEESDEKSHFRIFKALVKARESKAVIYGSTNLTVLHDSLITLTRIKAGSPGYLSAYNLSPRDVEADFSLLSTVPEELMVYALSGNYARKDVKIKDKVKSNGFVVTPRAAVVFTFVPNIEENN